MGIKAAVWVHGTIAQSEGYVTSIRNGWGATFTDRDNTFRWFHIPIATPVILDDIRPRLAKVFVFFQTNDQARIASIHIYDGAKRVKPIDNLTLSGKHNEIIDASNTFIINPSIEIAFGLGISVGVAFPSIWDGFILFSAVGADFQT